MNAYQIECPIELNCEHDAKWNGTLDVFEA